MEKEDHGGRGQRLRRGVAGSRGGRLRSGTPGLARQDRTIERGGGLPEKKVQTARSSQLSVRRQCQLLDVARSSLSYQPVQECTDNQRLRRILDEIYLKDPCLGSRRLVKVLERDHGLVVNRKRLQRLRRDMGQEAIWCRPRTTIPEKGHRK